MNIESPVAPAEFRSGFVGMAGVPNVGKSSLVNRMVGQKVTIVSHCPQTTRHRLSGIVTTERMQAVLVDVPGVLSTENAFNLALVQCADAALRSCDLILHIRTRESANGPDEERLVALLRQSKKAVFQVWNKIDLGGSIASDRADPPLSYVATHLVSAKTGKGIDGLLDGIRERLPRGPLLYPEDDISDRDLRFLAAEIVREKAFLHLRQEVPYGIATWVETWDEQPGKPIHIRAVIQTERDTHKAIIIGAHGAMLKKIGSEARADIEGLCGERVFLELWVQVRPDWRKSPRELDRLGISGEMS